MKNTLVSLAALLLLGLTTHAPLLATPDAPRADVPGLDTRSRATAPDTVEVPTEPGIAWFGTWKSGLAEAQRTGRPILLMSAAPQCHGVPGMW